MKHKHYELPGMLYQVQEAFQRCYFCLFGIVMLCITHTTITAQPGCSFACPPIDLPVQISLSAACEDTITDIAQLGVMPMNCSGPYTIEFMHNGMSIGNIVTTEQIGDTLMVIVTDVPSQNSCMFTAVVLDKQPPTVTCPPDTLVSCFTNLDSLPQLTQEDVDDCSEVEIFHYDELIFSGQCLGDTISKYNRTYIVVDENNNADTCVQMIWMEKVSLDDVVFPPNFKADSALICFPPPDTTPDFTGYPTVDGFPIINGLVCNLSANYSDQIVDICSGSYKILRTWTVYDWCELNIQIDSLQTIEVKDTTPPEIILPDSLEVQAGTNCTADVMLPEAGIIEDCSDPSLVVVRMETPMGTIHSNGGLLQDVPAGVFNVIYIATNDCQVVGRDTLVIEINDLSVPTPICKQQVAVPLDNEGMAVIPAASLNAGSYDNCGPVFFKVKRMDPPVGFECTTDDNPGYAFHDKIKFCCEDIGPDPVMVILRVYDTQPVPGPVADDYLQGHFSDCMAQVEVQDKIGPSITCPPDLTISCEFPFDPENLSVFGSVVTDPANQEEVCLDDPGNTEEIGLTCYGYDGLATDNCSVELDSSFNIDIDPACGTGTITRTFIATDDGGLVASCTQTITVIDFTPFVFGDIEWPPDTVIENLCEIAMLDPEDLPPPYNEPIVNEGFCDLVTFDHDDTVFDFSDSSQACFKILRKWKVLDWCQFNATTGAGFWSQYQVIKVKNTIPPEIDPVDDMTVCTDDPLCGPGTVTLEASGTDDCTFDEHLQWQVTIDLHNDQSFEDNFEDFSGPAISFDYILPLGEHRILYTLEDLCGNKTTVEQLINMVSCKPPSAKCMDIIVSLMPVDTDGDDTLDWGMIEIHASQLDAGSDHACGNPVTVAFSADPDSTTMMFDCEDVGANAVELWVIDNLGHTDFCIATVEIQDNSDVCPNLPPLQGGVIGGAVRTPALQALEDASVQLIGSAFSPERSDEEGSYHFPEMPFGGDYEVLPSKDGDDANGVSTIDLLIIQKHLLGISKFDSPYKHLAADANQSRSVSATDILELRKLILGIQDELPSAPSWRFIDADYQFEEPLNPLNEEIPGSYVIQPFSTNMEEVDFIAVKIGDLNQSATTQVNIQSIENRNSEEDVLVGTADQVLEKMEQSRLGLNISNGRGVEALQFTLAFDPGSLRVLGIEHGDMHGDIAWSMHQAAAGFISLSWFSTDPIPTDDVLNLLYLQVQSIKGNVNPTLSFTVSSEITSTEAYRTNGSKTGVRWSVPEPSLQAGTGQSLEVMQNRPNPFSGTTLIPFTLTQKDKVTLEIYDSFGYRLYTDTGKFTPGFHQFEVRADQIGSAGVLFYTIRTKSSTQTNRMIIARNQGG